MSSPLGATAIFKWFARALAGPAWMARSIAVATLSVAQSLASLISSQLVSDIGRVKESIIEKMEAETQTKVAEAAKAVNEANLPKRRDALAQAERAKVEAEAAKTNAEAGAIRMDAETRRVAAIVEAEAQLVEALSRLRQDGGELFCDKEHLARILDIARMSEDDVGVLDLAQRLRAASTEVGKEEARRQSSPGETQGGGKAATE